MPGSYSFYFSWDDKAVEKLKELWEQGYSCSMIAEKLGGGLSRNAVIGKVSRLGLPQRGRSNVPRPRRAQQSPRRVQKVSRIDFRSSKASEGGTRAALAALAREPLPTETPADVARVSFEQYDRKCHCMWPVGDPMKPGFGFCGDKPFMGQRYCEAHMRRAFQPPLVRRSRPTATNDTKTNNPVLAEV